MDSVRSDEQPTNNMVVFAVDGIETCFGKEAVGGGGVGVDAVKVIVVVVFGYFVLDDGEVGYVLRFGGGRRM